MNTPTPSCRRSHRPSSLNNSAPHRRAFLLSMAAAAAAAAAPRGASAQIVLRPPASGTDPLYVRLSQSGPMTGAESGKIFHLPDLGVKVVVFAPRRPEARLVVFSHDTLLDPIAYRPLLSHWASHGFAVVAPVHDDSVIERGLLARREDPNHGTTWDVGRLLADPAAWEQRVALCADLLGTTDTIGRTIGCRILTDRPIVAGHGFGAFVVQLLLGAVAQDETGRRINTPELRYSAGLMLSPQGAGVMGLTEDSWAAAERPAMSVLAGREVDAAQQDAAHKQDAFNRSPGPYKHLAIEKDAGQQFFTGQRASISDRDREMFDDLKAVTAAFLLAYANHDEPVFKTLFGDWFVRATSYRMDYASK